MYFYMLYIQFVIKKKNPLYLRTPNWVCYNTCHCQVIKRLLSPPSTGAEKDKVNQHPAAFSPFLRLGSSINMPHVLETF